MKKDILGVKIDDQTLPETVEIVKNWLGEDRIFSGKIIATAGPEFLLTARGDKEFREILNSADLCLPDGVGLRLGGINNTFAGVDLMLALCREASKNSWSIGLLGGGEGVGKKAGDELVKNYPGVKIRWILDGADADKVLGGILDQLKPVDLLFAAFGHPKQEKLLKALSGKKLFKVGMGVGGSLDYISGNRPRPSENMRSLGLEWLGRAISNPTHWKRIWRAVVVFPLTLFGHKLNGESQS